MIEMSAISATASPAPTATPLIALMIGVSHSMIVRTMSPASRITFIVCAWLPTCSAIHARSPPALNAFPSPVTTTARMLSSCATSWNTRASSAWSTASVALSLPGFDSVSSTTPCSRRSISSRW